MAPTAVAVPAEELSIRQITDAFNKLAKKYGGDFKPVKRFSDRKAALKRLADIQQDPGDRIIVLLQPEHQKRGEAARERFAMYETGMLVSEYVEVIGKAGGDREFAKKDVNYDARREYIALV